ncbi:MAG: S41 family peptidase [Gemmatimonadota bacterium]
MEWLDARRHGPAPLYLRFPDRRHWFAQLPDTRTVYARYREVLDDEDETVAQFADRLSAYLREHAIERLVLDIRGNVGGNGFLNRPLIRTLVRAGPLWKPGGLFVLIDRGTFSAAVILAAELERATPAIFVGEPTGGRPNGYGDSRRVRLPWTGLTVRVSTLFWQLTNPRDRRDAITPHVTVSARFADYRENRDPTLDTVLALVRGLREPRGTWRGTLGVDHQRFAIEFRFRRTASTGTGDFSLPDAGVARERL